jgi:hypothetical protein
VHSLAGPRAALWADRKVARRAGASVGTTVVAMAERWEQLKAATSAVCLVAELAHCLVGPRAASKAER